MTASGILSVGRQMTKAAYRLDVYDTSGALQYVLDCKDTPTSLKYIRRVNAPGLVTFNIAGDHDLLSDIGDKWQIEVWRKPYKSTWWREISAFYRDLNPWQYIDQSTATLNCVGIMAMLEWRHVAYYANTADRSYFSAAEVETIANTLVTYNATTSGTVVDGRLRAAGGGYPFTGLSVEADGGDGTAVDWYCAYDNLLETLQNLVKGEGDFDIVKTSSTAWQWRYYEGQLGTDRSATVMFALKRGNMKRPRYYDIRSEEKTVGIVGGQGEESERETAVRTGTNYAATNDIEVFIPAVDIDLGDTDGLNTRGDSTLTRYEAVKKFEFGVLDIESAQYGIDYDLGDLVTAINPYDGTEYTIEIIGVGIGLDGDGNETIEIEASEPR